MRNSVIVIFGLAAVLFFAESDSAAAREGVKRATDDVSKDVSGLLGEGSSDLDNSIKAEENSPHGRLHKRSPSSAFRQAEPDFDVAGLAASFRDLENEMGQIASMLLAPYEEYYSEAKRASAYMPQTRNAATSAIKMFAKLGKQMGKAVAKAPKPIITDVDIQVPISSSDQQSYFRQAKPEESFIEPPDGALPFYAVPFQFIPGPPHFLPLAIPVDPAGNQYSRSAPYRSQSYQYNPQPLPYEAESYRSSSKRASYSPDTYQYNPQPLPYEAESYRSSSKRASYSPDTYQYNPQPLPYEAESYRSSSKRASYSPDTYQYNPQPLPYEAESYRSSSKRASYSPDTYQYNPQPLPYEAESYRSSSKRASYSPDTYQYNPQPLPYEAESYRSNSKRVSYDSDTYQYNPKPLPYEAESYRHTTAPSAYDSETYQYNPKPLPYEAESYRHTTAPAAYDSDTYQYNPKPLPYEAESYRHTTGPASYDSDTYQYNPQPLPYEHPTAPFDATSSDSEDKAETRSDDSQKAKPASSSTPKPSTKPYPPEGVPDASKESTARSGKGQKSRVVYENRMDDENTYNHSPSAFHLRMKKN